MGIAFFALIKCQPVISMNDTRLLSLEVGSPDAVQEVGTAWAGASDLGLKRRLGESGWIDRQGWVDDLVARPDRLTMDTCFRTAEMFLVNFGTDAVAIIHPLPWQTFLVKSRWQTLMVNACIGFAALFEAKEGIITRDTSPIFEEYFEHASYGAAMDKASENEKEMAHISEMLEEKDGIWDSHGYLRFL